MSECPFPPPAFPSRTEGSSAGPAAPTCLAIWHLLSRIKSIGVVQRPVPSVPAKVGLSGGLLGVSEVCNHISQAGVRDLNDATLTSLTSCLEFHCECPTHPGEAFRCHFLEWK